MNEAIKIILVDDHPLMRMGVKFSLTKHENEMKVVAEASTADELLEILPKLNVDVVLLDIQMPGMSCEDAVRKIKSDFPKIKIIILSSYSDNDLIYRLVELGIDGFVSKSSDTKEIVVAIQEVCLNSNYYGIDSSKIIGSIGGEKTMRLKSELTEREKDVMLLCCEGLYSKEIAARLNISHRTVEMHKANIFKKLGINSTVELLKWAMGNGVVR